MQLYAITDRKQLPTETHLLELAETWATTGVHFIQLREKDLTPPQLQTLATKIAEKLTKTRTRLLLNIASPDAATLAQHTGAAGVHLAGPPTPGSAAKVRQLFNNAILSMPCHTLQEIQIAREETADLILFSPIFEKLTEKGTTHPQGLTMLQRACAAAQGTPVFALGGVTTRNATSCIAAGATGVAGIRLFATGDWRQLTSRL
jgi:thiamine-phosphate pyrophosphorylase